MKTNNRGVPSKGYEVRPGIRAIVLHFPQDMYDEIRRKAFECEMSLSGYVRELCLRQLKADE